MTTLTVWAFSASDEARTVLKRLESASRKRLLQLDDAAIVAWKEGDKRPKTQQLHGMVGVGAMGGAFWGMLFGLIFLVPLLGAAIGAAAGAAGGALADAGIDDDFIDEVRKRIQPGTSALFIMSSHVVVDKIEDLFEGTSAELVQTNLSADEEKALKETFHVA